MFIHRHRPQHHSAPHSSIEDITDDPKITFEPNTKTVSEHCSLYVYMWNDRILFTCLLYVVYAVCRDRYTHSVSFFVFCPVRNSAFQRLDVCVSCTMNEWTFIAHIHSRQSHHLFCRGWVTQANWNAKKFSTFHNNNDMIEVTPVCPSVLGSRVWHSNKPHEQCEERTASKQEEKKKDQISRRADANGMWVVCIHPRMPTSLKPVDDYFCTIASRNRQRTIIMVVQQQQRQRRCR